MVNTIDIEELCFVYLIGDPETGYVKYGISSDPYRRLNQLKSACYLEYEGFNIFDASILYVSPPMDRLSCENIEALWSWPFSRPFVNRGNPYEVIKGCHIELAESISGFIDNYKPELFIQKNSLVTHFFKCGEATVVFTKESNSHAVEVSKILKFWPSASLEYSCICNPLTRYPMPALHQLYRGRLDLPKQTHTVILDSIENVLASLLSIPDEEEFLLTREEYFEKLLRDLAVDMWNGPSSAEDFVSRDDGFPFI